jgi:hypothetical protein
MLKMYRLTPAADQFLIGFGLSLRHNSSTWRNFFSFHTKRHNFFQLNSITFNELYCHKLLFFINFFLFVLIHSLENIIVPYANSINYDTNTDGSEAFQEPRTLK